jgi:D-alanyl-D-alanine carboxypeptidase/D-alanyl-D-alanine-endopeptidase (penicillin-binding protein 4)
MIGTSAANMASAKTGTLDKARSLSGYITTVDGRVLLFSLLCNNYTTPSREVDRVQDLLVTTLVSQRKESQ